MKNTPGGDATSIVAGNSGEITLERDAGGDRPNQAGRGREGRSARALPRATGTRDFEGQLGGCGGTFLSGTRGGDGRDAQVFAPETVEITPKGLWGVVVRILAKTWREVTFPQLPRFWATGISTECE